MTLNANSNIIRPSEHLCDVVLHARMVKVQTEFGSINKIYERCFNHLKHADSEFVDDVPSFSSIKNKLHKAR